MLNIVNRKYLLLEDLNGNTTLLDKFEQQSKPIKEKIKKSESQKIVMPRIKKEVTIIEQDFDIKLPEEINPDKKESDNSDLKDLFKDSKNLKR